MIAWYPSRYIGLVYRDMLVRCIDNNNRSISRYYVKRLCETPCGFSADSIIACSARAYLKRDIPDAKRNQVLSCWFVRETHGQAISQRDLRIASCHMSLLSLILCDSMLHMAPPTSTTQPMYPAKDLLHHLPDHVKYLSIPFLTHRRLSTSTNYIRSNLQSSHPRYALPFPRHSFPASQPASCAH